MSKVNQDTQEGNNTKHLGKIKFKDKCSPEPVGICVNIGQTNSVSGYSSKVILSQLQDERQRGTAFHVV